MATYYAGQNGNNTNAGTKVSPLSLQAAANKAKAGDIVLVLPGIYTSALSAVLTIENSGAEGNFINFKASDPNNKPVIRVNGAVDSGGNGANYAGIKVLGSYINIDGFVVEGNRSDFVGLNEQGILDKLKAKYNAPMRDFARDPIRASDGIAIGDLTKPDKFSHDVTVRNSIVRDNTGGGIGAVRADYLRIENNEVMRNAFYSPYNNSGISFYQSRNFGSDNTNVRMIVSGNKVYENRNYIAESILTPNGTQITDGNGIIIDDNSQTQKLYGNNPEPYTGNTLIENNIVYSNGGRGILAFNSKNVAIRGNNVWSNLQSSEIRGGEIANNIDQKGQTNGAGTNIVISNNTINPTYGKSAQYKAEYIDNPGPLLTLRGTANADKITGESSGPVYKKIDIFGEDGNDILTGSNNANINNLFGGNGDDTLMSGVQNSSNTIQYNYFVGGKGNDKIFLDKANAVLDIVSYTSDDNGQDQVTYFTRGRASKNDQIVFSGFSTIDVVTKGSNTEFHSRYNANTTGNPFGTGALMITVLGVTGFNASDVGSVITGGNFVFS